MYLFHYFLQSLFSHIMKNIETQLKKYCSSFVNNILQSLQKILNTTAPYLLSVPLEMFIVQWIIVNCRFPFMVKVESVGFSQNCPYEIWKINYMWGVLVKLSDGLVAWFDICWPIVELSLPVCSFQC